MDIVRYNHRLGEDPRWPLHKFIEWTWRFDGPSCIPPSTGSAFAVTDDFGDVVKCGIPHHSVGAYVHCMEVV